MGLDMSLKGKRYLSEIFNEGDDAIAEKVENLFPELKGRTSSFDKSVVKQVEIEIGYWRKANAIHRWFVDNCQDGEDNCKPYLVRREDLEKLRDLCQQVLDDHEKASELLPPQEGFFFGSTDVNEWYFKDLEHTIKVIDGALTLPKSWEIEYQSSW